MLSPKEKHQLEIYCSNDPELKSIIEHLIREHRMELSKVSHEIRNPVTLLNSYLQLTQKQHPEVLEFSTWNPLVENMLYLRTLLDELSSYNNSSILHKSNGSITNLLAGLKDEFELSYKEAHISLQITEPIPNGSFDMIKLKSVFSNIIRNAVEAPTEHSHKQIIISITYSTHLNIAISNNGLPIPDEYIPTLFEPFVTHKKDGTGLGLAIAKNVITAHGGSIQVRSTSDVTTFEIELPL